MFDLIDADRDQAVIARPPYRLTTTEAACRFGIPNSTIVSWARSVPDLAEDQRQGSARNSRRFLIDPPTLAMTLAEKGRLDLPMIAARLGIPPLTLTRLSIERSGMLIAIWPQHAKPSLRKRRPPRPHAAVGEGGDARI